MKGIVPPCLALAVAAWLASFSPPTAHAGEAAPAAKEVFARRLLPIFKSPDPSSCVQCHLAGVDIKDYILPSHEDTFVSLRDQGLIDLRSPEKSKILTLIKMGEGGKGKAAVHEKARRAELAAFTEWVKASAADPKLRALPGLPAAKRARPKRPDEVIRHARKGRVLESFANNVWPIRFRCMGCHSEGTPQSAKLVKEHGPRVAWFKAAGPEATLDYLRGSKLINVDAPEKSLLLRKPLGEVKHGGGIKFVKGDQGHKVFLAFLADYARVVKDGYADAKSLPPKDTGPLKFGTDIWLKLSNTPPAWGDRLLAVKVFARDGAGWGAEPVATTDRVVWGKGKLWQHNLTLLAARGSRRAKALASGKPSLPAGRYLIKAYLVRDGKEEYVGQAEAMSYWPEGYGRMTSVDSSRVKK